MFISSVDFCSHLAYHFLFILFNCSLYLEYVCADELLGLAMQVQEVIIYCLIGLLIFMFLMDFVPRKRCSKKNGN